MEDYPCQFLTWRTFGSVNFQVGYNNVASLWPRGAPDWGFKTLGFNQISIGEKVCTWRSARFWWRSVVTNDFWRQHKEKTRKLQTWRWNFMLFTIHSGTLWWYSSRAEINGFYTNPSQVEKSLYFIQDVQGTSTRWKRNQDAVSWVRWQKA